VAELGNLTAGILLSPRRMSTVKIRARSLFRTPMSRIGAKVAGSGLERAVENSYFDQHRSPGNKPGADFPPPSTAPAAPSQVVHRRLQFRTCGKLAPGCKVN
jgi:hypothetical protein